MSGITKGSAATLPLPPPHRHTLSTPEQVQEQYSSLPTRWQYSTSYGRSSATETKVGSSSTVAAPKNRNSRSNEGHRDAFREFRGKFREPSSEDSEEEDSDAVFSEDSVLSKRMNDRLQTSPLRRQGSLHLSHERKYKSLNSHSSFADELRVWQEEERDGWEEDQCEKGGVEKRRPWIWHQERLQREEYEEFHRLKDSGKESSLDEVRDRRCSRSESVRLHDRRRQSNRELARTWSCKDSADKHVRFRDESGEVPGSSSVWTMLGHVLRERGVPVRISNDGASLQIVGPQTRDSQVLHGSEVSCSDSQPHQRSFQRASSTRHSFHGDIREKRRLSYRESGGRDHRGDKERLHNIAERGGEVYKISSRDSYPANREKGGSTRWRDSKYTDDHMRERNEVDFRVSRTSDERRNRYNTVEEGFNSEEEAQRRRDQPGRRAPQRSQSLRSSTTSSSRASTRRRSRHMAAGNIQRCSQLQSAEEKLPKLHSSHICSSHLLKNLIWIHLGVGADVKHFLFPPSSCSQINLSNFFFFLSSPSIIILIESLSNIICCMFLLFADIPLFFNTLILLRFFSFSSFRFSVTKHNLTFWTLTPDQMLVKRGSTWGSCSRSYRTKSWLVECRRTKKNVWGG